jgi:drug/metabolite transporter (DMT)-like permease
MATPAQAPEAAPAQAPEPGPAVRSRPVLSTLLLTLLVMVAFAGNSLLGRAALGRTSIDAATFTTIRVGSAALSTWLLARLRPGRPALAGDWASGAALWAYAAAFSFAYLDLPVGVGALLLFPAVQATMVVGGLLRGERIGPAQVAGLLLAMAGLALLVGPGIHGGHPGTHSSAAPPVLAALLMVVSGAAWGVYCLRGLGSAGPLEATAGNFIRASVLALGLSLVCHARLRLDPAGCTLAAVSGALASGPVYALWYRVMRGLKAVSAAGVQLSVPALSALGGVLLLGEALSWRMTAASVVILGGIALVLAGRVRAQAGRSGRSGR